MTEEKWFPIQGDHGTLYNGDGTVKEHWNRPAGRVPWAVAARAYETYVKRGGHGQSLETLAARGGFGWAELTWLLEGGPEDSVYKWITFSEPKEVPS